MDVLVKIVCGGVAHHAKVLSAHLCKVLARHEVQFDLILDHFKLDLVRVLLLRFVPKQEVSVRLVIDLSRGALLLALQVAHVQQLGGCHSFQRRIVVHWLVDTGQK